jgi:hypothetical protein
MKIPIPDDWDGETYQFVCWSWPKSTKWTALLRGLMSFYTRGRSWDETTGDVQTAQSIAKACYEAMYEMPDCEGVICPPGPQGPPGADGLDGNVQNWQSEPDYGEDNQSLVQCGAATYTTYKLRSAWNALQLRLDQAEAMVDWLTDLLGLIPFIGALVDDAVDFMWKGLFGIPRDEIVAEANDFYWDTVKCELFCILLDHETALITPEILDEWRYAIMDIEEGPLCNPWVTALTLIWNDQTWRDNTWIGAHEPIGICDYECECGEFYVCDPLGFQTWEGCTFGTGDLTTDGEIRTLYSQFCPYNNRHYLGIWTPGGWDGGAFWIEIIAIRGLPEYPDAGELRDPDDEVVWYRLDGISELIGTWHARILNSLGDEGGAFEVDCRLWCQPPE